MTPPWASRSETGLALRPGDNLHALLWTGTAASYEDLHDYLPPIFVESEARGIDADGNIVGWANDGSQRYAVMWTPVAQEPAIPEPATMALLGLGLAAVARRRRRK